jgi:histidinol-phosphate aminotransferase
MPPEGLGGELAVPTAVLARRLGCDPDRLIRLDGDDNPYGGSLNVAEALGSADRLHLPGDPQARDLRVLLEPYAGCPRERITVGAGAAELLERLLRVLGQAGEGVMLLPAPTRPLYAAVAARLGWEVESIPLARGFELNTAAIVRRAQDGLVRLIVAPSPNDPTGGSIPPNEVVRLLSTGVPVLVDESGYEWAGRTVAALVKEFDNLFVLRDLSGWAGLGGLPVAYLMSARPAADALRAAATFGGATTAPGRAAQLAAAAALGDLATLQGQVRAVRQERGRLYRQLRKLNLIQPLALADAHFLLCQVTRGHALALRDFLADQAGIIVRAYTTPPLTNHLRISVGRPEHTDALIAALLRLAEQHPL